MQLGFAHPSKYYLLLPTAQACFLLKCATLKGGGRVIAITPRITLDSKKYDTVVSQGARILSIRFISSSTRSRKLFS